MSNSMHGMYTLGVVNKISTFRGDFMVVQKVFEWLTNGKIRKSIHQTFLSKR